MPMDLPAYLLSRPDFTLDTTARAACDALLAASLQQPGSDLTERLPVPPWQFCSYLTDTHPVLIHGSRHPALDVFTPHRSFDANPFGNRSAVFAASDGIWPMFFALLDRERHRLSLVNGCFRVITPDGQRSAPYYFFSITQTALALHPWSDGTLYILPRMTFEQHPPREKNGLTYEIAEWASQQEVRPIARLRIRPADFPFLAQVRGHDEAIIQQRANVDPAGWPWIDEV
jgi:hypothetical protein